MTFQEFINKYDGKGVNYDGAYGNQCVDLYRQYVKEVCNVPQSPALGAGGANKIWDTYLPQYFERIANTPTGVPQFGDIIIWNTKIGPFGHVAIFISGNATSFTSFDQNFPEANGKGVAHKQGHDYKGVQGWLRLKSVAPPPPPPPPADPCAGIKKERDDLRIEADKLSASVLAGSAIIEELNKEIQGHIGNSGTMTKRIAELETQLELEVQANGILRGEQVKLNTAYAKLEGKLEACEAKPPTIITKPIGDVTVGQLIGEILRRFKFKKKRKDK